MALFLSAEWFRVAGAGAASGSGTVLEQVVEGSPEGLVVYRVEAGGGSARLVWPVPEGSPPPDVRLRCSWDTAVALARGDVSAQRALMDGRLRVSGDLRRIGALSGADPLPPEVRERTSWEVAGAPSSPI